VVVGEKAWAELEGEWFIYFLVRLVKLDQTTTDIGLSWYFSATGSLLLMPRLPWCSVDPNWRSLASIINQ
jgi:hypothetical protein